MSLDAITHSSLPSPCSSLVWLPVLSTVWPSALFKNHAPSKKPLSRHSISTLGDEPSSLAAESEPLLGPHLEDYWSHGGLLGPLWRTIG